ncbi:MAG: translation initiation factor [Candidatus Nanoarchaeia archaeon]|nr:translation initiation factor [Candidatus Nanoarchaeia archaeon]
MSEVCTKCGLPKQLCVCETIAKEEQRITVRTIKRKFGKLTTIVDGFDPKQIDLKDIAKSLKSKLACGGTTKYNAIELQGDHKAKVKSELIKLGFSEGSIDIE